MSLFLQQLANVIKNKKKRNLLIKKSTKKQLNCLRNVCYNICNKKLLLTPETKNKLYPHRKTLRRLGNKNQLKTSRGLKRHLIQSGGFLPALLPVLLSVLGTVGTKLVERAVGV